MKRILAIAAAACLFSTPVFADSLGSAVGGQAGNQSSLSGGLYKASPSVLTEGQQAAFAIDPATHGIITVPASGAAAATVNQGTPNAGGAQAWPVNPDSVIDGTVNSTTVSSAAVGFSGTASGYGSMSFQVIANASNNTVTIEGSNDGGTTWTLITTKNAAVGVGNGGTTNFNGGVGNIYVPITVMAQMRWRVSNFIGGTTTIATAFKRSVPPNGMDVFIANTPTLAPSNSASISNTPVVSTTLESCHVLKNSAGNLYSVSVTIQATSGILLLLNATSAPGDGAVTPIWSMPVLSNGTFGGGSWEWTVPMRFTTGITACFSSATTPFTKTASATAAISGNVQ